MIKKKNPNLSLFCLLLPVNRWRPRELHLCSHEESSSAKESSFRRLLWLAESPFITCLMLDVMRWKTQTSQDGMWNHYETAFLRVTVVCNTAMVSSMIYFLYRYVQLILNINLFNQCLNIHLNGSYCI